MSDDKINQAILDFRYFITQQARFSPSNIWHPKYGWIRKNGVYTESAKEWINEIENMQKRDIDDKTP